MRALAACLYPTGQVVEGRKDAAKDSQTTLTISMEVVVPRPARHSHGQGRLRHQSTGSLSKARTPNTHSWVQRSGSLRTKRSRPSILRANLPAGQRAPRADCPGTKTFQVWWYEVFRPIDSATSAGSAARLTQRSFSSNSRAKRTVPQRDFPRCRGGPQR